MYIYWIRNIWVVYFIFMLTLSNGNQKTTKVPLTLKDLKQTCLFEFPFDASMESKPPNSNSVKLCTAVGTYRRHPPLAKHGIDIPKLREGLPYVFIYNIMLYQDIGAGRQLVNPVSESQTNVERAINEHKIDVLIFDFLDRHKDDVFPPDFVQNICSLYSNLKSFKPDLLLGLMVNHQYTGDNSNLEFLLESSANKIIDLYVVNSFDYTFCTYHPKQSEMTIPPTDKDLTSTMDYLKKLGYPMDKVFLVIEVVVKSWKNPDKTSYEPWSYTHMCGADPGKKRKYCTQSLSNLYMQAKTIRSYPVAGIFIKSADYDDWNDNCGCGPFPAVNAIYNGNNELNESASCDNFGKLARDQE